MEIRQIKYFIAVADSLSFTRASELLFVSQPALSKQVSDLEEELGVTLLERTKRSVLLTPAGATFLQKAKELLTHLDSVIAITKALNTSSGNELFLNIGIERSILHAPFLIQLLQKAAFLLRQKAPHIRIHFCTIPEDEANIQLAGATNRALANIPDISLCKLSNDPNPDFGCYLILTHPLAIQFVSNKPVEDSNESIGALIPDHILYLDQTAPTLLHHSTIVFEQLGLTPRMMLLGISGDAQYGCRFRRRNDAGLRSLRRPGRLGICAHNSS